MQEFRYLQKFYCKNFFRKRIYFWKKLIYFWIKLLKFFSQKFLSIDKFFETQKMIFFLKNILRKYVSTTYFHDEIFFFIEPNCKEVYPIEDCE